MASIMKRVFSGLLAKETSCGKASSLQTVEEKNPPSPDLSGLSAQELQTLNDVFRRQTEFEEAEIQRIERIRKDLEKYEETIRKQAGASKKLKHVDLRLCKLCYKTKFADGIGRLCYDCHKRVCTRCGSFTRPRWNVKKNKSVRGKWRCNMCQLKRETLCKTGQWYGETQSTTGQVMLKKVNFYGTETESDISITMQNFAPSDSDKIPVGNLTDSELIRGMDKSQEVSQIAGKRVRRCSLPVTSQSKSFDEDEDDDNQEELHRERLLFRQKRQQRKWRRRYLPNSHQSEDSTVEMTSDTNDLLFSSGLSSEERKRPKLKGRYKSLPKLQLSGKFHSRSKVSSDSMTDDSSALSYFTKESSVSDCANSPVHLGKMHRQDAVYCSSSSSLVSDAKCVDGNGDTCSPLPSRTDRSAALRAAQSCCYQVACKEELLSRRVTLSQCQNIEIYQNSPFSGIVSSAGNPHEVILHKDRSDPSQRTKGLGMRIVGGKEGIDGEMGAFVTNVIKGGPADIQGGIKDGDQILEMDGQSLVGVTFEEARDVTDKAGNVVQLVVLHRSQGNNPLAPSERRVLKTGVSVVTPLPPNKPRRRMLPPTPIEIKKTTRKVSGRVQTQMHYSPSEEMLTVSIVKATDIYLPEGSTRLPKPFAMVHILPHRSLFNYYETEAQLKTRNPEWNKTFRFEISEEELPKLSVEITIWSQQLTGDVFVGEVLLDLKDKLPKDPIWYDLEDHDDNSSPLPDRKSSVGDISEADILIGSQDKSVDQPSVYRSLPSTPSYEHTNKLFVKMQTVGGVGLEESSFPPQTPSPINMSEVVFNQEKRQSLSKKVKMRMSNAVSKVSLSLSISDKRDSEANGEGMSLPKRLSRGVSMEQCENSELIKNRKLSNVNLDMLAPPHLLSRRSSQSSYNTDNPCEAEEELRNVPATPDRPAPDGDDITSILGPGQVTPKPSAESEVCGDVKLGFMITKGQLEVDIICARNLYQCGTNTAPDTYIKTYLVEGKKVIQKKKTQLVKGSSNPEYRSKIKYSASNVHGRYMRIIIWEKSRGFDKKSCMGETLVKLDNLDLSHHTMAWYKLFKQNATDLGSDDSLNW